MADVLAPVKYVLYSHYNKAEECDLKTFLKTFRDATGGSASPVEFEGIKFLRQHFGKLRQLLKTPGHEGVLVLFYSPGFEEALADMSKDEERLLQESPSLQFGKAFAECARAELAKAGFGSLVRFVTPLDIRRLLKSVNQSFAERFIMFMLGLASGLRYDSPKIPEAIVRLRYLGHGVPVLRLDHDVLFTEENSNQDTLGLFPAVAIAMQAYGKRLEDASVSTFIFSASYNASALTNGISASDQQEQFEAWGQGFATRIYPVLLVDASSIKEIVANGSEEEDWKRYAATHLEEGLARQYYGLKEAGLEVDGTEGMTAIGSHPLFSVISGALLCLSEGAILDLPPFSNFRSNVMWIDDHLKYCLHREMRHFTSDETLNIEPGLRDARLEAMVTKERPSVKNLPGYTFGRYLPTLFWGTIVDAWITHSPISKCRYSSLPEPEQEEWRSIRSRPTEGILPKAMVETLQVGRFTSAARSKLRLDLEACAIKRIGEVRQMWAALKLDDDRRSFASHWAEGTVEDLQLPDSCFKDMGEIWKGIGPSGRRNRSLETLFDLPTPLALKVRDLIDDALTYVEWTLEWPSFVQIVRAVEQGNFAGDMSWQPDLTPCGSSDHVSSPGPVKPA